MLKNRFLCLLVLLCGVHLSAQPPKYSNEFLSIGVGARALGMSNSVVASVDDVTSGYWNPAGISKIKSNIQVGLMHSEYFAGIAKYDFGALAGNIDSTSAFSLSVVRFGVDDIPNTTELIDANGNINYDKVTSFSAVDYGFLFSYGKKVNFLDGLRLGGSAKIIRRTVGEFGGAWGFGLDFGAQYEYKGWQFAAVGRDITSTFNAWKFTLDEDVINVFAATGNEIPENGLELTLPRFIAGVGKTFKVKKKLKILVEANMDITSDGKRNVLIGANTFSADPHMGMEIGYTDKIFLRTGFGNIQKVKNIDNSSNYTFQPNLGLGVKLKGLSIDYALTDIGDQSVALFSNVFSLRFDINRNE